jgi:hypothetical protein
MNERKQLGIEIVLKSVVPVVVTNKNKLIGLFVANFEPCYHKLLSTTNTFE